MASEQGPATQNSYAFLNQYLSRQRNCGNRQTIAAAGGSGAVSTSVLYGQLEQYQPSTGKKRKPTDDDDDDEAEHDDPMQGKDVPTIFKRLRDGPHDPTGSVVFGPVLPPGMLKRRHLPDQEDPDEDDSMQGKDVPTIFKRPREGHDEDPTAYQMPAFAPMYPGFFMFDGNSIYRQAPGFPPFASMPGAFPASYALEPVQPGSVVSRIASVAPVDSAGGAESNRLVQPPRSTEVSGSRRTRRRRTRDSDVDVDDGSLGGDEDSSDEQELSTVEAQLRVEPKEDAVFSRMTAHLRGQRFTTPSGSPSAPSEPVAGSGRHAPSTRASSESRTPAPTAQDKGKGRADQPRTGSGEAAGSSSAPPRPFLRPAAGPASAHTTATRSSGLAGTSRSTKGPVQGGGVPSGTTAGVSGSSGVPGTPHQEPGPSPTFLGHNSAAAGTSTFATVSDVSNIQQSLWQLNNNVSRLVTLVGEQIQYFSTQQARGGPPPTAAGAGRAASSAEQGPTPAALAQLRRRVAHDPEPTELPTTRDPIQNALAGDIREVVRELMGRKDSRDGFRAEKIPAAEEVENYNPMNGPACTIANFRPDLTAVPSTPWNASVIEIFVEHYCGMHPGIKRKEVRDHFKGHLKYLCDRYKLTLQGAAEMQRRQKLANRAERQRNLWIRRLAAASLYPETRVHIPILQALGPHGMSSDESDHEPSGRLRYRILRKPWRNPKITGWLRMFDKLYAIARLDAMTGSQPHVRVTSNAHTTRRPAVRGLPANAYNPKWFQYLTEYDQILLQVQLGVEYAFEHASKIEDLASGRSTRA